jgi:hypothetical protein
MIPLAGRSVNPPLERTAAAVYFTCGRTSRVWPPRPLNGLTLSRMAWLSDYMARRRRDRDARREAKNLFRAAYPRTRISFTNIAERTGTDIVVAIASNRWDGPGTDFWFFRVAGDGTVVECPKPASWGPIR